MSLKIPAVVLIQSYVLGVNLPRDEYKLITFVQYVDCLECIIIFPNFLRDERMHTYMY